MATTKQSDPQAEVNKDSKKVPDASEAAKSRGAEKGDVDVVKAEEERSKFGGDTLDNDEAEKTLKERDKAAEAEAKEAEKRDKEQQQALEKAAKAKEQPKPAEVREVGDVRSATDLANKSWTVQSGRPFYEGVSEVGQAFVKAQLPDRKVQKAAGIDPDQQTAGLVVLDDDNATKDVVSGPEPWESRDLGLVKH